MKGNFAPTAAWSGNLVRTRRALEVDFLRQRGGTVTISGVTFSHSSYPVAITERLTSSTTGSWTTHVMQVKSSGTIAAGFGAGIGFRVEDVDDGPNLLGTMGMTADATKAGAAEFYVNLYSDSTWLKPISATPGTISFATSSGTKMQIPDDGVVEFLDTAIGWKDINMGTGYMTPIAGAEPVDDQFKDSNGDDIGVQTKSFFVGDRMSSSFEIQHDYKEGSDIYFHVHWQGIVAPTGTDKLQWQLYYSIGRDGTVLPPYTAITKETDFDTQYNFERSDFAAIDGTNLKIGDQFLFRLGRISASSDEYSGGALLSTAGLHYQVNTFGSSSMGTK